MDGRRLAREYRALRQHQRLTQAALGLRARVSRTMIRRIERAALRGLRIGPLMDTADALGADLEVRLRWNGERLDRLLDGAHARLVDAFASMLRTWGWEVAVEVTFSEFGERGSIDLLAFQPAVGVVLVVEVKSVIPDAGSLLAGLDRKTRLAPTIAARRGWHVQSVAFVLVVEEGTTARRRVSALAATFDTAFPQRGRTVTAWLRDPVGPLRGLLFLPDGHRSSHR